MIWRSEPLGDSVIDFARCCFIGLATLVSNVDDLRANEQKAVVPFIDGMTIVTESASGTVEIRAQSLGPGFCASRFWIDNFNLDILAPPLSWSDWRELTSHHGSVALQISGRAMCDTGIVAEVRYFPSR